MRTNIPDSFTIKLTKIDRAKCSHYMSNTACMVATALRRRGFGNCIELVDHAKLGNGKIYKHTPFGSGAYDHFTGKYKLKFTLVKDVPNDLQHRFNLGERYGR